MTINNNLTNFIPSAKSKLLDSRLLLTRLSGFSIVASLAVCILSTIYSIEALSDVNLNTLNISSFSIPTICWLSVGTVSCVYLLIRFIEKDSLKRDIGSLFPERLKRYVRNNVTNMKRPETPLYPKHRVENFPGYYFPAQANPKEKATVILIGGNTPNNNERHHMDYWLQYYRQKNMNVILVDAVQYGLAYIS